MQTNIYIYCIFLFLLQKETTEKSSNVTTAKNLFSRVYVIGVTCFDECFLFYVITESHYFLKNSIITLRTFPTAMLLCSLKEVFQKRSLFYLISSITVQFYKLYFGKISLPNLIFWLSLVTSTFFSTNDFLTNSESLWKHVFTNMTNMCQNQIFIIRK